MKYLTNRSSSMAKHIRKLGKSKSYREEHGQYLCVGKKLLDEAIKCAVEIEIILTSEELQYDLPASTQIYQASNEIIDSLSPMQNSQGILFMCKMQAFDDCEYSTGTHILLDCIQDPGNLGTIIRSALAFGMESVILTDGCADLYNPKTVRATMGAIFKQKVIQRSQNEVINLKNNGIKFLIASNESDSTDITKVNLNNSIIVLGSEGQGVSDYIIELCNELIKIPISNEVESINVSTAAAIIMWEASKGEY